MTNNGHVSHTLSNTTIKLIKENSDTITNYTIDSLKISLESFHDDPKYWVSFLNYIHQTKNPHTLFLNPSKDKYYQLIFSCAKEDTINLMVCTTDKETYKAQRLLALQNIKKYTQVFQYKKYRAKLYIYNNQTFTTLNGPEETLSCPYYQETIESGIIKEDHHQDGSFEELLPLFDQVGNRYLLALNKNIKNTEVETPEAIIKEFYNNTNVMMITSDAKTSQIIDINQAALDFYGYKKDEILKLNFDDYNIGPNVSPTVNILKARPHKLKSGEVRWVDIYTHQRYTNHKLYNYSISFDVTSEVTLQKKLKQEKNKIQATLDSIGHGVVNTDADGFITDINAKTLEILKTNSHELLGKHISKIFKIKRLSDNSNINLKKLIPQKSDFKEAYEMQDFNKTWISVSFTLNIIQDEQVTLGYAFIFEDITQERNYISRIEYLSFYDELTNLYNRHYLEYSYKGFEDQDNYPLSMIMSNIDNLQFTNDLFSYKTGDDVIRIVADTFKKVIANKGIIGRWHGDKFVAILPNTSHKETLKLMKNIKKHIQPLTQFNLYPTVSMGTQTFDATINLYDAVNFTAEDLTHRKSSESLEFRENVIEKLLEILYENSNETESHSRRLEAICFALGYKISLEPRQMRMLEKLALLHDIGKSQIDSKILGKKGPLNDEEWTLVKKHPIYGFNIVSQIPELMMVAPLILSHHEHWDGSGYPYGLCGDDIPLESRILAIADAYDAMTHNRSYRKAMSIEQAKQELKEKSGIQFDPLLVEQFLLIPDSLLKHI